MKADEEGVFLIAGIAPTGKGIANVTEDGHVRPVFVSYTVPGDRCRIRIISCNKKYYEGECLQILEPSEHRVTPICPHFGICGACDFLHIDYDYQLEAKLNTLQFLLRKHGLKHPEVIVHPCKDNLFYRNRARISYDGHFGFYKNMSNEVVKIDKCFICNDRINDIFSGNVRVPYPQPEDFFSVDSDKKLARSDEQCVFRNLGYELHYSPECFMQANFEQNKELIDVVLSESTGGKILELFAGVGNFTLPLAAKAKVFAVEGNRRSYEFLRRNVKAKLYNQEAEGFLEKTRRHFDCVILDPPRDGFSAVDKLGLLTERIVYVSCGASTLAKDIKTLEGFEIASLHLVDMFPHTHHFEIVAALKKTH